MSLSRVLQVSTGVRWIRPRMRSWASLTSSIDIASFIASDGYIPHRISAVCDYDLTPLEGSRGALGCREVELKWN